MTERYKVKIYQEEAYNIAADQIYKILEKKVPHRPNRVMLMMNLAANISCEIVQQHPELKDTIKIQLQEYYMMMALYIDGIDKNGNADPEKVKTLDQVHNTINIENDKMLQERFGYKEGNTK